MTNEEYVRDSRFKAWGLCVKELGDARSPKWYSRCDLPAFFASVDWSETAILCQNTQFDASIMCWHYGVQPAFFMDTLSMARALRGAEAGNSLAKLAEQAGLPPKGRAVHSTDGMLEWLPESVELELAEYCAHDVWLCEKIFMWLWDMKPGGFPPKELRLIDMTLRMYVYPKFELDSAMLSKAIEEEKTKREGLLARLGIEEKVLASNPKFAEVLVQLGVEAPKKVSKTTGKETLALAKNDALFQALLNGDREDVALLCETRLAVKSTQARTRAQRFLDISRRGALPVALIYYSAHTGRWGGGGAINLQNIKRGSLLRDAMLAPDGYALVVGDLSQIEPRVLAWLADFETLLDLFRSGVDVYASYGSKMFGVAVSKKETPDLRQAAKSALLGAGYGLSWPAFAAQLIPGFMGAPPVVYDTAFAKQLGVTREKFERFVNWEVNQEKMEKIPFTGSLQDLAVHSIATKTVIDKYRETSWPIVALWEHFNSLITRCLHGGEVVAYKCLTFRKGEIELPNGMCLRYPGLRQEPGERGMQWVYDDARGKKKLYGSAVVANCTQSLARIIMTDGMLRVSKRYPILCSVHDEQIDLVPEDEAQIAVPWVREQMTKVPPWMPGIPLAADVDAGKRYGEIK